MNTLGETIRAEAKAQDADPIFAALKERARELHYQEGEIEIDDITVTDHDTREAILEHGGAHVLAWVWVDIPTTEEDEPEEYEAAAKRLIAKHQAQLAEAAAFAPAP